MIYTNVFSYLICIMYYLRYVFFTKYPTSVTVFGDLLICYDNYLGIFSKELAVLGFFSFL